MSFSVIIPTYNRFHVLRATFESIVAQTIKPAEVIVVDQSQGDLSGKIEDLCAQYRSLVGIRYIHLDEPSSTRSRNVGIKEAVSDWIIFCDDDVVWPKDLIRDMQMRISSYPKLVMIGGLDFEHPRPQRSRLRRLLGCISGLGAYRQDKGVVLPGIFGKYPDQVSSPVETEWAMGYFFAVRADLLVKHNILFDEKLKRYAYAEDLDFTHRCYRASKDEGLKCMLFPEIGVWHKATQEWRISNDWQVCAYVWNRYYISRNVYPGLLFPLGVFWIVYSSIAGSFVMYRRGRLLLFIRVHLISLLYMRALLAGSFNVLYKKACISY